MAKRVALALGSGGARGYAHIGVINELRSRGYEVVGIAGSSMGALVGGLCAAGHLEEFTEWAGTLVGFRFPDASDGVAIPGLHLHALAADNASGGHCHRATVVAATLTAWIDDVEFTVS